jgi:hypothetical protein
VVAVIAADAIANQPRDHGDEGLLALHIPLAFVIFGLTSWISARAVALARDTA